MKKTTTISLAKTLFHIEEDAYAILDAYLNSVRTHFAPHPDREEILADIESRIAERFSENGTDIITTTQVEFVIDAMGSISQFDTEEGVEGAGMQKATKRLYRDPDTRVLAGVASGLGYYLGVDRTIIRVLFVVSIFFGGFGVIAYLVLWIATPLAKSAAQKLEMHGLPVTLKAMSEVVRERFEEIDEKRITDGAKNLGTAIERGANEVVALLGPIFRVIAGTVLTVTGLIGAAAMTIFAALALFDMPEKFFGPSAAALLTGPYYYLAVLATYVALVLPIVIVLLWGIGILRKKSLFTSINTMVIAAVVWFFAIVLAGVTVSRLAYRINEAMQNDPSVIAQTVVLPVEAFGSLSVSDAKRVNIVIGDEYKVEMNGSHAGIDRTSAAVIDGVLTISGNDVAPVCMFCPHAPLSITVTVPTLAAITLHDAARVEGSLNASNLIVVMTDASRLTLSGSATTVEVTASDASRFDGATFPVKSARIISRDAARVMISADTILVVDAYGASRVTYAHSPELSVKKSDDAKVVPAGEE
ncbi:MAG TPA: PspC domain-containing protein [Candidatus Paceibacterota bacterium]